MPDTAGVHDQLTARLAGHTQAFEKLFAEYFESLGGALDTPSFSRFTPECLHLLRELSLRGGKRIRVVILNEAARLVTDGPVPGLEQAALSLELLHSHGLIHDDLIDDSPTRRGGPSTYYAYRERFPGRPRTALGLTVLAGDLALALSLRVLLDAEAAPPVRQAMIEAQTRAAAETFLGQIIDLERDVTGGLPVVEVIDQVADYKSARYSLLAPLRLGLLAAGAQPERHDRELSRYARLVGICAQMRDDYLDLFGDGEVMGKPTGTDIRDGKRSYVVTALLSSLDGQDGLDGLARAERAVLEAALGDPACTAGTIDTIREIAEARGVAGRLRARMRDHAEQAALVAEGWRPRWRSEAVAFFELLPHWSVERSH
ncbi:polyprenyl synthetase family protein [Streptomyces sp. NPDC007157]|uniref:polyprenyl synthetase family protein n=1 Tax=Streptomyces sp. NPDC007157 TaxID=3154681 RepID=UPI00340C6644